MFSGLIRIKLEMIVQISGRKETCSLAILINNVINSDTRLDLKSEKKTHTHNNRNKPGEINKEGAQVNARMFCRCFCCCCFFITFGTIVRRTISGRPRKLEPKTLILLPQFLWLPTHSFLLFDRNRCLAQPTYCKYLTNV